MTLRFSDIPSEHGKCGHCFGYRIVVIPNKKPAFVYALSITQDPMNFGIEVPNNFILGKISGNDGTTFESQFGQLADQQFARPRATRTNHQTEPEPARLTNLLLDEDLRMVAENSLQQAAVFAPLW